MLSTEQTKTVADGTILLQEGKSNQQAFMITKGKVSVSRFSEGRQDILLAELREGEMFGEMSLLEGTVCSATVKAIGNVELQVFNKENFIASMQEDEHALQTIMNKLFLRIRAMNKQVAHLEDQVTELSITPMSLSSDKLVLKALSEPAKHAMYDMNSVVVDECPFQIGRWSKRQDKTSWFSRNKIQNNIDIRDIPPYVISRQHCRIEKKNNKVFVTDLDSHLGTWVNGYKIGKTSEKAIQLKAGVNQISLGNKKSPFSFELYVP